MSNHFSNHTIRWLPAILWGAIILVLSLMPGGQADRMMFGIPHFDKIGHFGMYTVWAFLVFYAFSGITGMTSSRGFLYSLLVCGLTGVVLEFGQYYLATARSFELADMVANAAGAVGGAFAGWKGKQWLKGLL